MAIDATEFKFRPASKIMTYHYMFVNYKNTMTYNTFIGMPHHMVWTYTLVASIQVLYLILTKLRKQIFEIKFILKKRCQTEVFPFKIFAQKKELN